jgi:hypothetical protein
MKKPDRFDELVKARMEKDGGLWSDNVADLLRKEHRAVVQMVRSVARWQAEQLALHRDTDAITVILSKLKERAR